jgi:predicted nucleotidyltransferase
MGIDDLLKQNREVILALAEKHGVSSVRVFGSVARGVAGPNSDVDFLIDVRPGTGWQWVDLWDELETLLGRKVDLIPANSLRESIRENVLREALPL